MIMKERKIVDMAVWWLILTGCLTFIARAVGGDPEPWSIPAAAAVISWMINNE